MSDVRAKTLSVYGIVTMAGRIGLNRVLIGTAHDVHNVDWGGRVASYKVAESAARTRRSKSRASSLHAWGASIWVGPRDAGCIGPDRPVLGDPKRRPYTLC